MTSSQDLQLFLNSNITTDGDLNLDKITGLLALKRAEQSKLDAKLQTLTDSTRSLLNTSLKESQTHRTSLIQLENSFAETVKNIDQFVESSKSPLLDTLSTLEQNLRTIENAKSYVKALLIVSELSSQALTLVQTEPDKAMTPYTQLVKFEQHVNQQSMDQYNDLSLHLKKSRIRLKEELDAVLAKNFKESLDALSWPTPIKPPYGPQLKPKLKVFEKAFRNLLILQQSSQDFKIEGEFILSPLSIMLEGLSLRFRFHFETSKPTNRIDKPEWYLQHVKNTISTHLPFLMTTIQPILESSKEYLPHKVFIKDQFISGLLKDVTRKLQHTTPQLLNQPSWLSHTISQVLQFDKSLLDDFAYDQPISNVVLSNPAWFNAWFGAEKSFAQARYDEIMLDGKAFEIYAEDDLEKPTADSKSIKRTKSAVRLINLLENITSAYNLVPDIAQKFKFLVEIQLDLLGQYQKRLSTAIDSFEALSLIRSVPVPGALPDSVTGVMTSTETGGIVSALHRLYKWWTSARSIMDVLKDWTEDDFFLDMQYQISQEPSCIKEVSQENERSNMLRLSRLGHNQYEGLFDDAITAYEQLIKRTEKIIVKMAIKEWMMDARKYAKKDTWWQTSTDTPTEISDELYEPLQDLRVTWNYLHGILPEYDFLNVFRQSLLEIEDWYWKNIITQSQFSSVGALQLETDLKLGLWKIGQRWVLKPENLTKKLKEAIQLLTLPFSSEKDSLSCDVLMKALADTNQLEFVQKTLEKLGIETLSNGQIRDVLRRRNDMLYSWN
ncbi:TIP-1 family-domain-containing protein [Mucor mucedo]|uniref:TIP-1 family-domain-containing protein n=1 Tax=Mucor mucedo TaxID=29922 RepID=UPI00221F6C5C|nr:TIP-1 family-domain-containing protein [Mucor mucedo]KAI7890852.1 TIP-1 family-domain-containing protein [Mucor mucedo]